VLLGCFVYLVFLPPSTSLASRAKLPADSLAVSEATSVTYGSLVGGMLLGCYLLFDGLTTTTQEHCFGKKSQGGQKKVAPLTPGGPVLDQMVYVNLCATLISLVICAGDGKATLYNLRLVLADRQLLLDSEAFAPTWRLAQGC
jgi:hypothetical protein